MHTYNSTSLSLGEFLIGRTFHRNSPGICWTCCELVSLQLSHIRLRVNRGITNGSTCLILQNAKGKDLEPFKQHLPEIHCIFILETFTSSKLCSSHSKPLYSSQLNILDMLSNFHTVPPLTMKFKNEGKLCFPTWVFYYFILFFYSKINCIFKLFLELSIQTCLLY